MQFRHFLTFVFKHFSQKRFWVRVFARNFCALIAGRYVSRGRMGRHALSLSLRFATKILYEIMLLGFLCSTKPLKRAVHGAVLLAPASMQVRFCAFMGIISTVSKSLRYALLLKRVSPRQSSAYVPYVVESYGLYVHLRTPALATLRN